LNYFKLCCENIKKISPRNITKVFFSYAWYLDKQENGILQSFLLSLRDDLMAVGIEVLLDITNISGNITDYMKSGIETSDFIIIIGTKRLKERYEEKNEKQNNLQIEIKSALEKSKSKSNSVIPIVKEYSMKESIPSDLHNFMCVDFTKMEKYEEYLFGLENPRGLIPTLLNINIDARYKDCIKTLPSFETFQGKERFNT